MPERIVNILNGFRRRLVAVRAAEAAGVAATISALTAATLMAARILVGVHPSASMALAGALAATGILLAAFPAGRRMLGRDAWSGWALSALLAGLGIVSMAAVAVGVFSIVPKNSLVLLVPACGLAAAVVACLRGAPMGEVVTDLDRQGRLAERLSTAWELRDRNDAPFVRAVHDQAAQAIAGGRLGRVRFWTRTRATLGALGLAMVAMAVMLLWTPLESPAVVQQRRWRQVAPMAGEVLGAELEAALANSRDAPQALSAVLRRLEVVAEGLKSAAPDDAKRWDAHVLDLTQAARTLRRFLREGGGDAETRQRLRRLLGVIEQAAADLAAGMGDGGGGRGADPIDPDTVKIAAAPDQSPSGWTTVYNPAYADLVDPSAAPAGDDDDDPVAAHQWPYDRQWMLARARAARAVETGEVPWEYRDLVEGFFATGP